MTNEEAITKTFKEYGVPTSNPFFFEILKVLEQEHCEDCISRQAVLEIAKSSKSNWIDNSVLFKRVNELPPVTPKPKTDVLDKIRAEIIDTGAYEQEVNGKTEFLKGINYCLGIIDKYTAEQKGAVRNDT